MVLARPRYQDNPLPPYPERARRRQLEGTVVLEAWIGEQGKVGELVIHASSGHRLLDEAALKAAGVSYEGFVYPGAQHGFNNDTTPRFDKDAAALAWKRTLDFFAKNLKSEGPGRLVSRR